METTSAPSQSSDASTDSPPAADDQVTPEPIMEVGMGFWASKTLLSAVKLGLFTLLAEEPRSARDIQEELDLLMSLNMLIETPGGFDFTMREFSRWTQDAGFSYTECLPLAGPASAAIAYK